MFRRQCTFSTCISTSSPLSPKKSSHFLNIVLQEFMFMNCTAVVIFTPGLIKNVSLLIQFIRLRRRKQNRNCFRCHVYLSSRLKLKTQQNENQKGIRTHNEAADISDRHRSADWKTQQRSDDKWNMKTRQIHEFVYFHLNLNTICNSIWNKIKWNRRWAKLQNIPIQWEKEICANNNINNRTAYSRKNMIFWTVDYSSSKTKVACHIYKS